MGLVNDIQHRINYLSKMVEAKEAALEKAPEGYLKIQTRENAVNYYRITGNNKSGIYLPKNNFAEACSLAQKTYDKQVLKAARAELKSLKRISKYYESAPLPEDCYSILSPNRSKLVRPIVLTDDQYIEQWKNNHPP